jgi:hypothetical protein
MDCQNNPNSNQSKKIMFAQMFLSQDFLGVDCHEAKQQFYFHMYFIDCFSSV